MAFWLNIDSAPRDGTVIQAKIEGYGSNNFIAWHDNFLDSHKNDCGGWVFIEDREPPPSWTDGVCWEQNEDGVRSAQPTKWKCDREGLERLVSK